MHVDSAIPTVQTSTGQRNSAFCRPATAINNIGRSYVTYLWSQCDRHFVGQHVVLWVVKLKWWRFVALFESNWISWFKKMSVLSLSYWESDVYWRQNNKHFAELAPQNGGKQLIWRNYVTVTLCISRKWEHSVTQHFQTETENASLWWHLCSFDFLT